MTKIAISPNVSGTGSFTIAAPNSNTDRTLTLPDEAGTVLSSVSNIEAQVKTATNATGTAPIYACRAWVNFDGTGTVAIRASGNVSSITDNGTGDYTINFTTPMPDANYAVVGGGESIGPVLNPVISFENLTAASVGVGCRGSVDATRRDTSVVSVTVFR